MYKEKKLLFIYNPNAGKGVLRTSLSSIIEIFMNSDYEVTVYATRRELEAVEIVQKIGKDYDRIVCSGGDGTMHEIIDGVMSLNREERPECSYIPTGTVNDFAKGVYIPSNLTEAAKIAINDNVNPIDIGIFNNKYFSYVAAFGAFTSVSYETSQTVKNIFGKSAYVFDAMSKIPDIKPIHAIIETDNDKFENDFLFGSISNAISVGGFNIFKNSQVSLSDGYLEGAFLVNPTNVAEFQNMITSAATLTANNQIIGIHSRKFTITFTEPTAFTLDGEDGGVHTQVTATTAGKAIDFVWGKPEDLEAKRLVISPGK